MPTSLYMPAISVEIAFDGGFRVPMVDWTWTDVSDYVELDAGINGSWGRQDERSTADANTLSLTLDNSDGRFTAARVTSPYYPDVKLYKPIRVLADPVDGAEAPLFTGYITSWPVQWEDTSAYAKATITAASRLSRLGLNARWRSIVEQMILADGPVAYYPLGEPEGATTAADASGRAAPSLVMVGDGADVTFGTATGPGTDGLTAATFAGDRWLSGPVGAVTDDFTLETFVNTSTPSALVVAHGGGIKLVIGSLGNLAWINGASEDLTSPTSIADGATHHVALTHNASTGASALYVDGVVVDSTSTSLSSTGEDLNVGGYPDPAFATLTGVLAHTAFFTSELSADRVEAHATAGLTAWAGETTDTRFERYAAMAGIPAAEVDAEAGATTMVHVDTTDQNVVDLLRIVEATEAGVLFDALDGKLTLHGRGHRYSAASVLTLDMAKHEVESDYSPRLDPSTLANDITAAGVTTAHIVDDDSVEAYGTATASLSTASEDVNEPLTLAGWTRYKYADPQPRVPSLSVDVTAQAAFYTEGESTVSSADLLAVTIGDKITVANHPQQAALSITDYFVEGGSFSIGHESFKVTWNVSPVDAESSVLILDSPTQGLLDTNVLAL